MPSESWVFRAGATKLGVLAERQSQLLDSQRNPTRYSRIMDPERIEQLSANEARHFSVKSSALRRGAGREALFHKQTAYGAGDLGQVQRLL